MGDERAVYADKAYDKRARRKALEERGVFVGKTSWKDGKWPNEQQ